MTDAYDAWKSWCYERIGGTLGKLLRVAFPSATNSRHRREARREHYYVGVRFLRSVEFNDDDAVAILQGEEPW